MMMSLFAHVRPLYPLPYVGGCPDGNKISTFSESKFIHYFIRLNTVQNKYGI